MFSNYDYDIIIIGGGISGLFLAYKLLNTNLKIIVLEGNKDVGGRVKTVKKDGTIFEAGAARFHNSHGKFISLLHDLDLKDDMIRLPTNIDHILRNNKVNFPYQTKWKNINYNDLLKESVNFKKDFDEKELQRITFFQYLTLVFDHETASYIKDAFGYDSEFIHLNADAALKMFESDFFSENHYYILKNGLSQVIEKMEKAILNSNIILKKNCSVVDINNDHVVTNKGDKFFYSHLICAIPQQSLKKFDYFKENELIQSVTPFPLLRIYAKYPTKNLWFENIERTTTDNYIRQVIPIDYENGLIMISYTDDKNAEVWNSYHTLGDEYLITALHKEIKDLFGIQPPNPEFISVHYWKDGVNLWKLGKDSEKISKAMLKPDKEKEVYICGEAFSLKQGWIEGALASCYSILNELPPLKNYEIVNYEFLCEGQQPNERAGPIFDELLEKERKRKEMKEKRKKEKEERKEFKKKEKEERKELKKKEKKEFKKKEKEEKEKREKEEQEEQERKDKEEQEEQGRKDKEEQERKDKEEKEREEKEKNKPENKFYTIDEVLDEDEWIIIEVDGKKNIYDLSDWIPEHPGGTAIFKGIDANNHYKDKKAYPESPTDLFNSVHYHAEEGAFNKFFKKENEYVKFIGRLK